MKEWPPTKSYENLERYYLEKRQNKVNAVNSSAASNRVIWQQRRKNVKKCKDLS